MYRTITSTVDSVNQSARELAKKLWDSNSRSHTQPVQNLHEGIHPMPQENVLGPGRDRAFQLPQYFANMGDTQTAFFDAGSGDPVIFIHGLAANLTHWVHIAPHFSRRFRVLGLDLPGCGESPELPQGFSVDNFRDHIIRWMDYLNIERATVVGHSLGGMITTSLAIKYPERIRSAVLVNPAGVQPMPLPFRIGGHIILRDQILSLILPKVWKGLLSQVFGTENRFTEGFYKTCEETFDDNDVHGIAKIIAGLRHDILEKDFAKLLGEIQVPTHLIWGDKDLLVPARLLRRAAKKFSRVHAVEIKKCGHMPNIEYPFRLIHTIEEALQAPA
jgi:pimeloyl-ACP methyl ester carboxylesterase